MIGELRQVSPPGPGPSFFESMEQPAMSLPAFRPE
jgi:hypothetical protein